MDDFDSDRFYTITKDNIQSQLQIDEMKRKYGNRLVAYRYMVELGKAEFLISKETE